MRLTTLAVCVALAATAPLQAQVSPPEQVLPGGARWIAEVPATWNGTLLLWSRGYSNRAGRPESAPADIRETLLARGYALAGSDYGSGGWALAEAVPAQVATIEAFGARHGKPRRVIAWGYSMGGLVTTALAEQQPARIDGGIALCSSIGGAVGMMNMGLDGAFAFRTLVAPAAGIALTGIADDRANGEKVSVALAAVLAGIPGWTSRDRPAPPAQDAEAQVDEIGRAFVMGVFLPRGDQEARAGTGYSWNAGIDYRRQLALSGRGAFVRSLYRKAGLSLDADLAELAAAPRISRSAGAVSYMEFNYTPSARPSVPLLAVQAVGDGATSPSMQRAYGEAARSRDYASLWLGQAGHCGFSAPQLMASIAYLEARLDLGRWSPRPAGFVAYRPPAMLRPCFRGRICR
jgi:pimeloyl-ACP methyl ester carboxylesterase